LLIDEHVAIAAAIDALTVVFAVAIVLPLQAELIVVGHLPAAALDAARQLELGGAVLGQIDHVLRLRAGHRADAGAAGHTLANLAGGNAGFRRHDDRGAERFRPRACGQ